MGRVGLLMAAAQTSLDLSTVTTALVMEADVEQCTVWMRGAGVALAGARDKVGVILWRLRSIAPEAVYVVEARKMAKSLHISDATLTRWRTRAEKEHGYAPVSPRSAPARNQKSNASAVIDVAQDDSKVIEPRDDTSKVRSLSRRTRETKASKVTEPVSATPKVSSPSHSTGPCQTGPAGPENPPVKPTPDSPTAALSTRWARR